MPSPRLQLLIKIAIKLVAISMLGELGTDVWEKGFPPDGEHFALGRVGSWIFYLPISILFIIFLFAPLKTLFRGFAHWAGFCLMFIPIAYGALDEALTILSNPRQAWHTYFITGLQLGILPLLFFSHLQARKHLSYVLEKIQ